MPNLLFMNASARRACAWGIPRFLRSYDETLTGDLIVPRGLIGQVGQLVGQAGSKLEITDERQPGNPQAFDFLGALDPEQQAAHDAMAEHQLGVDLLPEAWIAPQPARQLRALLRHRASLVRLGTQLRNRIHAVAADHGYDRTGSYWTGPGRNTSTAVHLCRSPSQDGRISPPESRPVAVLSCCVHRLAPLHATQQISRLVTRDRNPRAPSWRPGTRVIWAAARAARPVRRLAFTP